MADYKTTEFIETLAAEIGSNAYIEVVKWRLRLDDAHLHVLLAERFYPLLERNDLTEDAVLQILRDVPVSLGGGRREVPLLDCLSEACQQDLIRILEMSQRSL